MRYREIYERIRSSIMDGKLLAGDRLPSARTLAAELNVARGTVDTAYLHLAAEGFVASKGRNGTFVSQSMPLLRQSPTAGGSDVYLQGADPEDFRYLFESPHPLMPGLPSFDQFPRKLWYRTVAREARKGGVPHLTYPDPLGLLKLRQAVASHIAVARGIHCRPEQIVITAGYLGALALVCRAILKPGVRAWIEAPGYGFTRRAIQMVGAIPVPISVDQEGVNVVEGLRVAPKAALCVVAPSNQFPIGACLSLRRRAALLDWAARYGSWIVEDDYTGEFRYDGRPLPALKSLDNANRVFYVGTFSKTMFPGLRLGYLVAPESQFSRIRDLVRRLDGGRSMLEQAAVAEFITEGHFGRHIKKMRALYKSRRIVLMSAISDVFGSRLEVVPMSGGLHLVTRLGGDESDVRIEDCAGAAGLRPLALSKMGQGKRCGQGLVLGFANLPEEQVPSVVRRLKKAIRP